MSAALRYDDPLPTDRTLCSRFGASALPCGKPYKVRVTPFANRPGAPEVERRTVLCQLHYEADVNAVRGGLGGVKKRAKDAALDKLAGLHREEFQRLFDKELAQHIQSELGVTEDVDHE